MCDKAPNWAPFVMYSSRGWILAGIALLAGDVMSRGTLT